MRIVCALDEAVEKHDHLVQFEDVISHREAELLDAILKEEKLSALRVCIEELVSNLRQGLNHQLEKVVCVGSSLSVATALARDHRVHILEGLAEEREQVRQIEHALGEDLDDLIGVVLQTAEDVDYQLVWHVLESLVEVADATIWVLLEHLELWILLVQFVGHRSADDVCKNCLNSLLVTLIVLDGKHDVLISALLSLQVGLLPHHSDRFVCGLDRNRLDVANSYPVDGLDLGLLCLLLFDRPHRPLHLPCREIPSPLGVLEPCLVSLCFAHALMVLDDTLSGEHLGRLVIDPLELMVLHLSRDSLLCIFGHRFILVLLKLDLNWLQFVVDPTTEKSKISDRELTYVRPVRMV